MTGYAFIIGAAHGAFLAWLVMFGHKRSARMWRGLYEQQRAETDKWFDEFMRTAYDGLDRVRDAAGTMEPDQ